MKPQHSTANTQHTMNGIQYSIDNKGSFTREPLKSSIGALHVPNAREDGR